MTTSQVDATDAAVSLAAEHDIDLADVTGSGANGRITKGDVEARLASLAVAVEAVEAPAVPAQAGMGAAEETAVAPAVEAEAELEAPAGPRAGGDEAETAAAAFADRVQAAGTLQALIALGSQATGDEERELIRARAKELLEK